MLTLKTLLVVAVFASLLAVILTSGYNAKPRKD